MRAKYNDFVKRGMYGDHKGLSCFSPVINIMRHPQWGRNQVSIRAYSDSEFVVANTLAKCKKMETNEIDFS